MCGVVGGRGDVDQAAIDALTHRGPDAGGAWQGKHYWLGHRRLAIVDTGERSNQPFRYGDTVLSYNGELWNFAELKRKLTALGSVFTTDGDTEVVAAALDRWGADALPKFEGMFALAWSGDGGASMWLARDRFGEVPLHWMAQRFASELKAMPAAGATWFPPGCVARLTPGEVRLRPYYEIEPRRDRRAPSDALRAALAHGVQERELSDVGFCVLLSGGIDSSAVAYHLATRTGSRFRAYLAVGAGGRPIDERCAREVAERLELELRVVRVPEPSSTDLTAMVRAIEMPFKAQVEIAWACWWLGKAMRADGERVTFSGEGSDELWASYGVHGTGVGVFWGVQQHGWYEYRRRLFTDQHRKNFARCNKIFMANGIECRLPFLSTGLVELGLGFTEPEVRDGRAAKAVLTRAYAGGRLPLSVTGRKKLAFQEGAGLTAACGRAVADPQRYYRAEFFAAYPGAEP